MEPSLPPSSVTVVADGRHVVPDGVAVEEMKNYDRSDKLAKQCPPDVEALMIKNKCMETYERMVLSICDEKRTTRGFWGKWQDEEVVGIIDLFRDDFASKGIKVALCKRSSGGGTYRWLEFIDIHAFKDKPPYVPQYDVGNYSGQVIKTMYCTLKFPNGVAVEEFKRYKSRKTLGESIPIYVEKMMKDKDLMAEYNSLVSHIIEAGDGGKKWSEWDIKSLKEIADVHTFDFEKKGVSIFVCNKVEYVSHGQSGHNEYFRWLEFVDREQQPNYHPQRDSNVSSEKCIIS